MRWLFVFMAGAAPALADPPVVEAVTLGTGSISVTISHPDSGRDHYADLWRVFAPDGSRLAERVLVHPHVDEQPFTRSLRGVMIPDGVRKVIVRVSCTQDGWYSEGVTVDLSPMGHAKY